MTQSLLITSKEQAGFSIKIPKDSQTRAKPWQTAVFSSENKFLNLIGEFLFQKEQETDNKSCTNIHLLSIKILY